MRLPNRKRPQSSPWAAALTEPAGSPCALPSVCLLHGPCFPPSKQGWVLATICSVLRPLVLAMSFHSGKARVWDYHGCFLVFPHQYCCQQEFLQVFTQLLPELIPALSKSRALVPCTGPCHTPSLRTEAHTQSSFWSWHPRGAIPDFGCSLLSRCCSSCGWTHCGQRDWPFLPPVPGMEWTSVNVRWLRFRK